MSFTTVVSFILVGACWGCTTPFIKDGTSAKLEDKSDIPDDDQLHPGRRAGGTPAAATPTADKSRLKRMLAPLRSLTSMRAMVPFALNQSGSTLFYYLLSSQEISTAVPVCNALSLVFTAATAAVLGEKVDRPLQTLSGMVLVLAGLAVCVTSKA